MAAETELRGTILFNADTSEAEKQLNSIEKETEGSIDFSEIGKELDAALEVGRAKMKSIGEEFGKIIKTAFSNVSTSTALGGSGSGILGSILGAAGGGGGGGARTVGSILGNIFGGVGGAGAGGGGAAAGGSGGLGAAGGVASGIGVAIAAAMATVGIIVKTGEVLKGLTEGLVQFGRTLTDASAAMAYSFAAFDLKIMYLKNRIGDELAPAMGRLLDELVGLFKDVLPAFSLAIRYLIWNITTDISFFRQSAYIASGGATGEKPTSTFGKAANGFVNDFQEGFLGVQNIATFGLINRILPKVESWLDKFINSSSNDQAKEFMDNFHEWIVNEKSAQWQAAQTARSALTPAQQHLYNPPPAFVNRPGGGTIVYPRGVP